jgi:hypothetical protein
MKLTVVFLTLLFVVVFAQSEVACDETLRTRYSTEEKAYFAEIALGTEYGDVQTNIHKWTAGTTVGMKGNVASQDARFVRRVIAEINTSARMPLLEFSEGASDIMIYILPSEKFRTYEPNYVPGNFGFFWFYWSASQELYRATVLIDDRLSLSWRKHLLRELLTRALGLANNSSHHEASIFGEPSVPKSGYLPIDRTLIEMLYRCDVESGMNYDDLPIVLR